MKDMPRLPRKVLPGLLGGLLVALATACIVSVDPPSAVNEVGTEHTITVTFLNPTAIVPPTIIIPGPGTESLQATQSDDSVQFMVISGPNAGTHSDGDCVPSCNDYDENFQMSWTYRSNGVPGTDTILVCGPLEGGSVEETESALEELLDLINENNQGEPVTMEDLIELINQTMNTNYEDLEDMLCETVQKTWVRRDQPDVRPPNIGAGLSGLFSSAPATPTPVPTAVAPSTVIRPPSTGDAGLR